MVATYPVVEAGPLDGADEAGADCVGPAPISAAAMELIRALAAEAGVDRAVPLALCAGALAARLSRADRPLQARVIHGRDEHLAVRPNDPGASLAEALHRYGAEVPGADPDEQNADVTLLVTEDDHHLYVETSTNERDVPSAACWARGFVTALAGLVAQPDRPIATLPAIDDQERQRILHGLNPNSVPVQLHPTVVQPFEEQVERTPDAVALIDEDGRTLSYRQLNDEANRLARHLRASGAGSDTRVAICMARSIEQLVAIYAAVKSGATYVPIDTDLPDARIAYIINDAAPVLALTDQCGRNRLPAGPWRVIDVVADRSCWSDLPATNLDVACGPADLIHILYTSGTTGRPKGVAYPHSGVLVDVLWMQRRFAYRPGDTALFKTSAGFDVSIWEIFWPLHHGARLVVCRPGRHSDAVHLARLVDRYGVATLFLVPTVAGPFLEKLSGHPGLALRRLVCGGEPMTPGLRDLFYATLPNSELINAFGPTEAGSVTENVLEPDPGSCSVPVGRPHESFRVTLLDENLDLVPVGMAGEAYISGEIGLAQAYWRAPARTAERFVPDCYGPPGTRMYRTGDLCRYREDGRLEHLGRIDRQIKIAGQRVEPGEIESVALTHPAVTACAVLAHGRPARLIAFVVASDPGSAPQATDIRRHVATTVPRHMRLHDVVVVSSIPTTVNGKIDSAALLSVWAEQRGQERLFVPPADALEKTLAEVFATVLGVSAVSMLDTLVSLGGHSVLAFEVLDECGRLGIRPDVETVLKGTIRAVAASIRNVQSPHDDCAGAAGTEDPHVR